ncbi:GNAT family N-acetyltransferase [Actinoplanes sp. NPDC026670]|uniref:GNAT family N-acetyltransferase n=1 Tax=Actinoplanes sp. NPDC026670 TaxID=3154700 RepID=UPI0033C8BFD1
MASEQAVEFRELTTIDELERLVDVFCQIWNADTHLDLINPSTLRAMVDARCYVVGMYLEGVLVGGAVALRGPHGGHLHSHIAGVHPKSQGLGLGYQLKRHQAEWAAKEGFARIRWTYDPLVRRNAHFNLAKLGGRVLGYEKSYYGELNDGLNDNDETDRLVVDWDVHAVPGAVGPAPVTVPVVADKWDFAERPAAVLDCGDGLHRLVPTPVDVERLRLDDPARAHAWRLGVRAGFAEADAAGFVVTGFNNDGWYVLRRP